MDKNDMLKKLRKDRPDQVIHEVISFDYNDHGFYNVKVDMESMFSDTVIRHINLTLPYPLDVFNKLKIDEKFNWLHEMESKTSNQIEVDGEIQQFEDWED